MIPSCDSLIHNLQTPLGNRPLCFRTTVAGRGLLSSKAATMKTVNSVNITPERLNNFWGKVNKSESCWEWTGSGDGRENGYGKFRVGEKMIYVHRISWMIHFGEIPHDGSHHGVCICHKCDNRKCVNPKHLFLGTNSDNAIDKFRKGRGRQKVAADKVIEIRRLCSTGNYFQREIAKMFGISDSQVGDIQNRKAWAHI